ncbi:phosphatase PAP2 family protein [Arthrobacter sp. M4]|uniref:phosphatase PAP2 family protein n=1 Tax=Arthrobacter sp. M4 TaxID=218160 RepID=UPI001CDBDB4F|nr:phosphatase PAP2 family protein [Arthrobacter sp. M4]MCA4134386.1 phosphatase PAP2 family protein [Arthrobacter sp. M4]
MKRVSTEPSIPRIAERSDLAGRTNASLRRLLVVSAGLFVAGDVLFWAMYAAVASQTGLALLDVPVHDAVVALRSGAVTALFSVFATLTSPIATAVTAALTALVWAVWRRDFWRPGLLLGSMALAAVLSEVVKHDVGRTRPSSADFLQGPDASFSFPSGHTLGTSVFLLVLAYVLSASVASAKVVWATWATAAVGILAVAFCRLYLGYHWLTDVLASIGLACGVAGVAMLVDGMRASFRKRNGQSADTGMQSTAN